MKDHTPFQRELICTKDYLSVLMFVVHVYPIIKFLLNMGELILCNSSPLRAERVSPQTEVNSYNLMVPGFFQVVLLLLPHPVRCPPPATSTPYRSCVTSPFPCVTRRWKSPVPDRFVEMSAKSWSSTSVRRSTGWA